MSLAFFSVANINQFQELMYRPLYWFGKGATPDPQPLPLVGQRAEVRQLTASR